MFTKNMMMNRYCQGKPHPYREISHILMDKCMGKVAKELYPYHKMRFFPNFILENSQKKPFTIIKNANEPLNAATTDQRNGPYWFMYIKQYDHLFTIQ